MVRPVTSSREANTNTNTRTLGIVTQSHCHCSVTQQLRPSCSHLPVLIVTPDLHHTQIQIQKTMLLVSLP